MRNGFNYQCCCLFLILLVSKILNLYSFSTDASTRFDRSVENAANKFYKFGNKTDDALLIIDGNNVRGIAKFQWNPIELTLKISQFCRKVGIGRTIVVWDHGRCKFAAAENDLLNRGSDGTTQDMTILFSGLTQRADDVIVKESSHIVSNFYNNDWSKIGFVTNDGGLKQRLIQRSGGSSSPSSIGSKKRSLIMDSTRFVELLAQCQDDENQDYLNSSILHNSIQIAEQSLYDFAKLQRLGYNPRREKTWERCVLADTLLRAYCQQSIPKTYHQLDSFSSQCVTCLQERGFSNPSTLQHNEDDFTIPGPTRLDKRQKRLLNRYNKALLGGQISRM